MNRNALRFRDKLIEQGDQHFKSYAEYILESLPDTNAPMLRDYYKHNASVPEILAHTERIEKGGST